MEYLKNAWYMVGWAAGFEADKLVPFTLLDESVVIYRTQTGFAALEDRCCHRLTPLSCGRIEGDDVRCLYHGLKFNAGGACVEVPGQDRISPKLKVRSYLAVERHSAVWLWMGEVDQADESLIPNFVGVEHPDWAMIPGFMSYQASYRLINDNLLDLSHLTFVHSAEDSFAAEGQWIESKITVEKIERGVRVSRWIPNAKQKGRDGSVALIDRWATYDFLAPGVFLLHGDTYAAGTAEFFKNQRPDSSVQPLRRSFTCQAITPVTKHTSVYFFAFGPEAENADQKEMFYRMGKTAFEEDRQIVEAQQKCIDSSSGQQPIPLAHDQAVTRFNRLLDEMIAAEASRCIEPVIARSSLNG